MASGDLQRSSNEIDIFLKICKIKSFCALMSFKTFALFVLC
jgi:hypothetical protein